MQWRLAEAKNKFSEVVRLALTEGPQRVVRRGDAVVVLSEIDYQRLAGERPGFKQLLMEGPDLEGVVLDRVPDLMRDVDP
jgi:prevent-host-death family protein